MTPRYKRALNVAENYDLKTEKDCLVLFSISKLPTKENKEHAFNHVEENPQKKMIDYTPCGKRLEELNLFDEKSGVSYEDAYKMWYIASKRLIENASGNVTAFIKNAHPDSTFRKIELPAILANKNIPTINNVDKWKYENLVTANKDWYKENDQKGSKSLQQIINNKNKSR